MNSTEQRKLSPLEEFKNDPDNPFDLIATQQLLAMSEALFTDTFNMPPSPSETLAVAQLIIQTTTANDILRRRT